MNHECETRAVGVADVLHARDMRAERQRRLLEKWGAPLISFTMNIAGSIKRDGLIERAFLEGAARVEAALKAHRAAVLEEIRTAAFTGCEQLWAVRAPAEDLKAWMRAIEEADALGRLFDLDVIDGGGRRLSRTEERKCLICGGPVRACARNRAHSAEALYHRAREIIAAHFDDVRAVRIGMCAERALLLEALVTPKPGLVDRANSGAHRDMDLFSFASSACALRHWFETCARTGMRLRGSEAEAAFEALRAAGVRAEAAMLRASGGANTHRGALFSLGLICCAAGMEDDGADAEAILRRAGEISAPALRELRAMDAQSASSAGERQYVSLGLSGARGEAAAGFPSVRQIALPALRRARAAGKNENDAGVDALLQLMARVEDSNVLHRGGEDALHALQARARELCENGAGEAEVRAFDGELIRANLSPGGCADLLAAAYCALFLEEGYGGEELCPQT